MSLYRKTFYNQEADFILTDRQTIAYMLQVEAALARSQAKFKIIPETAAETIVHSCNVQYIDLDKLINDIPLGGNVAIPLVQQLTRTIKNNHFESSKYVHLGATSQDIIDTAWVLQIKDYIQWLEKKLNILVQVLRELTKLHRTTLMIGRTLLQHARPITFGLKTAGWLKSILNTQDRIQNCKSRVLKIQMYGAAGNGNAYMPEDVVQDMADSFGITLDFPWQSHRDSVGEWASVLGILSGSIGKIARDISLLMQTEISELSEGSEEGKGGSSTMPHKRNPVACSLILANSIRIPHLVASILSSMTQEHERSAGLWHAEWEVLNQLMGLTAGSLTSTIDLLEHLEVNEEKMKSNLEMTKGLIYSEQVALTIAGTLGRISANELVQKASKLAIKQNKHLKDLLLEMHGDLIQRNILEEIFNPVSSMDSSLALIDSILKQ